MNSVMKITTPEFAALEQINVFHRQLDKTPVPPSAYQNCHILFRREFSTEVTEGAMLSITADDYYKLWVNGEFVGMGPAPSYTFRYCYNKIDISSYLKPGRNVIAVHTYYQGLINRVWVSGDNLHMFCCALDIGGKRVLESDKNWKYAYHTGYSHLDTTGYETQFLERYNAGAPEVGFEEPDFDDSDWCYAVEAVNSPHTLVEQKTSMLVFETLQPASVRQEGETVIFDLGQMVVGYPSFVVKGAKGEVVDIFCGQELNSDGSVRYKLRCNCEYAEKMVLSGREDTLVQYDYKAFRYVELHLPQGACFDSASFKVIIRHYPYTEAAQPCLDGYEGEEREMLSRIWKLCSDTLKYGVQEVIQDCPDREKGFYLGDGCYTALTHLVLTGDRTICRKLIYDALASAFITPGLVTCIDCSLMQEIAEYPLMLIGFVWAYYRYTGDVELLCEVKQGLKDIMEDYRARYEGKNGLLSHLDRWCVVEWPAPYRDSYDVDITEGKVCEAEHAAINAYYVFALKLMNLICR
ncbi:MAG: family 78 glycoside hydrolase catalytic domain, partial [Clostridiales bacterium]|nr:family 78 glycoside hydrolase catalytic domain [Clostridiales bacterium]